MFDPFPLVHRYPDNGEAMPLVYCAEAKCFACAEEDDPRWTKDHESGEWWCPRHAAELAWISCGCGFKTRFTGDPSDTLTNGLCRSCARYGRVVKQRELEDLHRLEVNAKYPFLLRQHHECLPIQSLRSPQLPWRLRLPGLPHFQGCACGPGADPWHRG